MSYDPSVVLEAILEKKKAAKAKVQSVLPVFCKEDEDKDEAPGPYRPPSGESSIAANRKKADQVYQQLLAHVWILLAHKNELKGRMDYVESLILEFSHKNAEQRALLFTSKPYDKFAHVRDLLQAYNVETVSASALSNSSLISAVHIVDPTLVNAALVLFPTDGHNPVEHLVSPANGVLIPADFAGSWKDGRLIVLPATLPRICFSTASAGIHARIPKTPGPLLMTFVDGRENYSPPPAKTPLWVPSSRASRVHFSSTFQTTLEPVGRYLCFRFLMSVLVRRRFKSTSDTFELETYLKAYLDAAKVFLWANPPTAWSNPVLYKLAQRLGMMTDRGATDFWRLKGHPKPLPEPVDEAVDAIAMELELFYLQQFNLGLQVRSLTLRPH